MSIDNHTQNIRSLLVNGQELSSVLGQLKTRQDSITAALSSASDDYNTEIIDARASAFGISHENIGGNIRESQLFLYNLITENISLLQSQINSLSAAVINLTQIITKGDNIS